MAELDPKVYNTDPNQMINAARGLVGLQKDKFELVQKQLQQMQSMFGTLALKKDLAAGDIHDVAARGAALGLWSPQQAAVELGNMPNTPEGLRQYVTGHLANVMSAQERFNQQNPQPQWIDNGANKYPIAQSGLNPEPRVVGQPMRNDVPPTVAHAPTQIGMQDGRPLMGTQNQFNERATGQPLPGYPTTQDRPAGANGYPTRQPMQQQQPSPVTPNAVPTVQAPPLNRAPGQMPGGGILMGQPLGQHEAASGEGSAIGGMIGELGKAVNTSPQRKAALSNLSGLLDQFTSGPGMTDWNKVKTGVNANLPLPAGWEMFNPKNIASQEEFRKQAVQLAQQQFAAIGGTGTDEKFGSAVQTSPSEELSKMGNKGIIALLRGNEDALSIKAKEWQKWREAGNGPETLPAFNNAFNKSYDPRTFQFKHMKPDDRAAMVKSMSKEDRASFARNLKAAQQQGWVNPNGE